jgi:hypothetical protein
MSDSTNDNIIVPTEFTKIIIQLVTDILTTFPEYMENLDVNLVNIRESGNEESILYVYNHVKQVIPERFFDILYKNEEMFTDDTICTVFLPGVEFKEIWNSDISESTKEIIWKYLQLLLFTIIGKVDSQDSFGDTTKLFESINEDELKGKLEDTLGKLQEMLESEDKPIDVSGVDHLPNPEQVQDHITGLLDGKLGRLAKEIAEETASELNLDAQAEGATSINDVFQSLFKNPGKLMSLVKNVGGKLDDKIKSGEIKENEIMAEAAGLLGKMKDVPGMGDIQNMMKNMGMGGRGGGGGASGLDALNALSSLGGMGGDEGGTGGFDILSALGGLGNLKGMGGKGGKLNLGAMQNMMEQNIKSAEKREKMKTRMNEKAEKRRSEIQLENERLQSLPPTITLTDKEMDELIFSIEGEKAEKSVRPTSTSNKNKKKKKKGKK